MGLDYFYVNQDKDQFFDCGLFGTNSHFSRAGSAPGARALVILLSCGSWKGDRISVVSDCSAEFEELVTHGLNVEVEAELMLIEFDGLDWIEELLEVLFNRMCCYALLLRHPGIIDMLDRKYGVGKWQRRYEKHLQGNSDCWSQRVIDAQNRGLNLLGRQTG
jgi:hypothetical protein